MNDILLTADISPSTENNMVSGLLIDNSNSFGCCSQYRQCSEQRKCLMLDHDFSANCIYRRNLEAGKTFYGKNADGFSRERYDDILSRVNVLPQEARDNLDAVLIDCCEYHRGYRKIIANASSVLPLNGLSIFLIEPIGNAFPEMCSLKALEKLIEQNEGFAERYAKSKAKKQTKQQKGFLIGWLNHQATDIRDELAAPYRYVSAAPGCSQYIEELYNDLGLSSSLSSRIYPVFPLDKDDLRNPADRARDEERRIRMSHGYTDEQKVEMLSTLHQK